MARIDVRVEEGFCLRIDVVVTGRDVAGARVIHQVAVGVRNGLVRVLQGSLLEAFAADRLAQVGRRALRLLVSIFLPGFVTVVARFVLLVLGDLLGDLIRVAFGIGAS